jgi:hypothetical protein
MANFIVKRVITPKQAKLFRSSVSTGRLNHQTIHKNGEGKMVGFVGEVFMDHIFEIICPDVSRTVEADTSYDYDIVLDGIKVDVKTKQRTVAVAPHHDVSIADYRKQSCDSYAFCSVTVDIATKTIPLDFYYIGYMETAEFMNKSSFMKKNQLDGGNRRPDGSAFRITKDCWNLKCNQLNQFDYDTLLPLLDHGYQLIQW